LNKFIRLKIHSKYDEDPSIVFKNLISFLREEIKKNGQNPDYFPQEEDLRCLFKQIKKDSNENQLGLILNQPLTMDKKPFLRLAMNSTVYYKNKNFTMKIFMWCSDYFVSRMRNSEHFYIDGTFDCVPNEYTQLITIMILDCITNLRVPACFVLVNTKIYQSYKAIFQKLREILRKIKKLS